MAAFRNALFLILISQDADWPRDLQLLVPICHLSCIDLWYFFFPLQPEYFLLGETAELVRWVLRNKISKRREVLRHPCILSPPWSLFLCLGAHVPFALLSIYFTWSSSFLLSISLILRHGGKVLAGKNKWHGSARNPPKPVRFVYWDYPALGFKLSPSQPHPSETLLPLPL